ncbi:MAG: class I SAM-dependent methyltransferase family protein [Methanotrichaceae archaeon]|nr:class I SAM-dependent methyltransferase family protein [Methanotrichaceae archaeon]
MSRVSSENKNFAVRINKNVAQITLNEIIEKGLLDKERKVKIKNGFAEIPVRNFLVGYDIVSQDRPEFYRNIPNLRELLEDVLNPEELDRLPRGWHFLGELLIVKIHPALDTYKHLIGRALLSIHPRCKSVLRDFGIEGQFREPVREVLAGGDTTTIHKENGVLFKLDASKIMFSQGNLKERLRMSHLGKDEFVMDMFAGIGYFSIPMAVHSRPRKIIAIELNKLAYNFLKDNIKINQVEDIVEPVLGDCVQMAPEVQADRVVMGMVQVTDRYLLRGIDALRSGGILHYHQTMPSWHYPQAAIRDVDDAAKFLGYQPEIINISKIKKYAPGIVHAVLDARIQKSV